MKHVPEDWGYCDECETQREHELHKQLEAARAWADEHCVNLPAKLRAELDRILRGECRDAWHMWREAGTSCGTCGARALSRRG